MLDDAQKPRFGMVPRSQARDPWWHLSPGVSFDPDEAFVPVALNRHFMNPEKKGTTHFMYLGNLENVEGLIQVMREKFGEPSIIRHAPHGGMPAMQVWIWPEGMFRLNGQVSSEFASTSEGDIQWAKETLSTFSIEAKSRSSIYMASRKSAQTAVTFLRMGSFDTPLERGNYDSETLAAFDRAVKDLGTKNPRGRIILLEGKPGGGKTFLIKGLTQAVNAAYIVVNPKNYEDLMDPEFMHGVHEHFMDVPGTTGRQTIVFILEDADKLLQPRQKGASLGGLSSALNMGDGLLSELMDVRIIATTNAHIDTIDEALTRAGRLSECIHLDRLGDTQIRTILKRLLPKIRKADLDMKHLKGFMLADVYARAKDLGWEPPPKEAGKTEGTTVDRKTLSQATLRRLYRYASAKAKRKG